MAVDGKNCLDNAASKDTSFDHVVKAPANLVVIEGDCLDSTDGGGELESYLVALYFMIFLIDEIIVTVLLLIEAFLVSIVAVGHKQSLS